MATLNVRRQICRRVLPQPAALESASADNPGAGTKKRVHGFATGDLVRAVVPTGRNAGTHTGRVAVRTTGSFNITTVTGTRQGVHHRHVSLPQRAGGYGYTITKETTMRVPRPGPSGRRATPDSAPTPPGPGEPGSPGGLR